jgi:hypothetical protein
MHVDYSIIKERIFFDGICTNYALSVCGLGSYDNENILIFCQKERPIIKRF